MADPLSKTVESLKFKYLLIAGVDASLLLIPKRRSMVKLFAERLVDEVGEEAGSAPYVFDALWNDRLEMSFCNLAVRLYDGDDLAVGNSMQ
jgi:hypothetical protein